VLCLLRDGTPEDEKVSFEFTEIKDAIALEEAETGGWTDCFTDGGIMGWQRVAIACSAQALQEFTGTNIITYYAPYVMVHSVGLDSRQALLLSGGLQLWFLVASIIPWYDFLFVLLDLSSYLSGSFSTKLDDASYSFWAALAWAPAC
jgi:hypothetical protein